MSDTVGKCGEPLDCGQTLSRTIEVLGDLDTFTFKSPGAERVSIDIVKTEGTANFNPCWRLFAPDGTALSGYVCNSLADVALPQAGIYTVEVVASSNAGTGSYNLSREIVSGSVNRCGEPLGCGQTLSRMIEVLGDLDTFTFESPGGERVSLNLVKTEGTASFVPCWRLFAPDGTALSGYVCNSLADVALPQAGIYTVEVVASSNAGTGSYNLSREIVSGSVNRCGEPLGCGQTLSRMIEVLGDLDTFTFASPGGKGIDVNIVKTGGTANFNPCWRLFAPDGTALSGYVCNTLGHISLPTQRGIYTIEGVAASNAGTGAYNLSLGADCQPPPPPCTTDAECADGLFCNGIEHCVNGACVAGNPRCPDDGLFCDGTESCNETTDSCHSSGNPCPIGQACDENTNTCGAPDLVETSVSNPPANAVLGDKFDITDTVKNQGVGTGGPSTTRYYLSLDAVKSSTDKVLTGTRAVPGLLASGTSTGTVTVTIPASIVSKPYFLLACADDLKKVSESNENNNCIASQTKVQVTGPDLMETAVNNPPASAVLGDKFPVTDTTTNTGDAAAGPSTTRYYLSLDKVKNSGDKVLTGSRAVPSLVPGDTSTGTVMVTIPAGLPSNTYYLLACADDAKKVAESNENNNCIASLLPISVTGPDLVETSVSDPPASAPRSSSFAVTDCTKNLMPPADAAAGINTTRYYLSLDKVKNSGDKALTGIRTLLGLQPGEESCGTVTVTVPSNTLIGTYYLLSCADDLKKVAEKDENNNCRSSTTQVTVGP